MVFVPCGGKRLATSTANSPSATICKGTLSAVSTQRMWASSGNSSRRGQSLRKSLRSRSSNRTGVCASSPRVDCGSRKAAPPSVRDQRAAWESSGARSPTVPVFTMA